MYSVHEIPNSKHVVYINCSECQNEKQFVYKTCSEHVVFMYWAGKLMNNLLSNCGLVDMRIIASEKDLPVTSTACTSEQKWRPNSVPSFTLTLVTCNLGLWRKRIIYNLCAFI